MFSNASILKKIIEVDVFLYSWFLYIPVDTFLNSNSDLMTGNFTQLSKERMDTLLEAPIRGSRIFLHIHISLIKVNKILTAY